MRADEVKQGDLVTIQVKGTVTTVNEIYLTLTGNLGNSLIRLEDATLIKKHPNLKLGKAYLTSRQLNEMPSGTIIVSAGHPYLAVETPLPEYRGALTWKRLSDAKLFKGVDFFPRSDRDPSFDIIYIPGVSE